MEEYVEKVVSIDENELTEVSGGKTVTCIVYVVKKHDTLRKIAKEYNTTVAMLVKLNDIDDPDLIKIGQKLYVPAPTK